MGENSAETKTAVELLLARTKVQEAKMNMLNEEAAKAYLKWEELTEVYNEFKQEGIPEEQLMTVTERAEKYKRDYMDKCREFERLRVKLEENKEMLKILTGNSSTEK